jgi:hypothetical protein
MAELPLNGTAFTRWEVFTPNGAPSTVAGTLQLVLREKEVPLSLCRGACGS